MKQKGGVLKWTREVIDNNFDSDEEEKQMEIVSDIESAENIIMPFQWGDTVEVFFSNGKKEKGIVNLKQDHLIEILFSNSWVSLVKEKNIFITHRFQDFTGMEINSDVVEIQLLQETSHTNPVTALQITSQNALLFRKLRHMTNSVTVSFEEETKSENDLSPEENDEISQLILQSSSTENKLIPVETSEISNTKVIVTDEPINGVIIYNHTEEINYEYGISIAVYGIIEIINLSNSQVDSDRVSLLRTVNYSNGYEYTSEESFQEIFETLQKNPIVNDLETMTKTCHNLNTLYQELDTLNPFEHRWEEIIDTNQWGFAYFIPVMDFFIPVPPKQILNRGIYIDDPDAYAFDAHSVYKNKSMNFNTFFYRESSNPINYEEFVNNLELLHAFDSNNGAGLHNKGLQVHVTNSIHMANHLMLQEELKESKTNINLFRTSSMQECKMRGLLSVPGVSPFQQSDFNINTKNIIFDLLQRKNTSLVHFRISLTDNENDEPILTFSRVKDNNVIGQFHVLVKELEQHHPLNVNRLVELTNKYTNVMVCLPEHRNQFPANIVSNQNDELVLEATTRSRQKEQLTVSDNDDGNFTFQQANQEPVITTATFVDVNMLCDFEYEKHLIYYEFDESLISEFEQKLIANDVMNYLLNLHGISSLHRYLDEIMNLSIANYDQFNKIFEKYNVNVLQLPFQDVNLFNTIILDKIKELSGQTKEQIAHLKKLIKDSRMSRNVIKKYNEFHITFPIQTHLQHLDEFYYALHEWKKSISHHRAFISKTSFQKYVEEVRQTTVPKQKLASRPEKWVKPKEQTFIGISNYTKLTLQEVTDQLENSIAVQEKQDNYYLYEDTAATIDFKESHFSEEMMKELQMQTMQLKENIKVEGRVNEYKGSLLIEMPKQRQSKGSLLWEKYSSTLQHAKIAKLMRSSYYREALPTEDGQWYYDVEGNQVICKHWDLLINLRLSNSGDYDQLITEYGRRETGTGFYSCSICGEKLTQIAYSSDEFSKDHTLKSGYTMLEKTSNENIKSVDEIMDDLTKPLERNVLHFIQVFFNCIDVKQDGSHSEEGYFTDSDKVAMMEKIIFFINSRPYVKQVETLLRSKNPLEFLSEKYANIYEFLFITQMYAAELNKPANKNANDEKKKEIMTHVAKTEYINLIATLSMGYLLYKLQTTKSINISLKSDITVTVEGKQLQFNLFGFPSWKSANVDGLKYLLGLITNMKDQLVSIDRSLFIDLDMSTRYGGSKRIENEKKKLRPFPTSEKDMLSRYYHSINYIVNTEDENEVTRQSSISIPLNENKEWSEQIKSLSGMQLHHKILFDNRREYLNISNIMAVKSFRHWTNVQQSKKEKDLFESNHKMLFYDTVQILQLMYPYQIYPSLKRQDDPFVTLLPIYFCYNAPYNGFPRIFANGQQVCHLSGEQSEAYDGLVMNKNKIEFWKKENPNWTMQHARKLLQQIEQHQIIPFNKEKKNLMPLDDQSKNGFAMFFWRLLELDLFPEEIRDKLLKLYHSVNHDDIDIDNIDWNNESIFMIFRYIKWDQQDADRQEQYTQFQKHIQSMPSQGVYSRIIKLLSLLKVFVKSSTPCDEDSDIVKPMYANQRKWRIEEMHMKLLVDEVCKKHDQIKEIYKMIGHNTGNSLQVVYTKIQSLQDILQSLPIEMVSRNPQLFQTVELFVMNNIYFLMLSDTYSINTNVLRALVRYFIPALLEEEKVFEHYADYKYIREAKEKADEREKEFFKAQFQNVPAELRQMEDQLKNLRLGTYAGATRGQNEQVSLF